MSLRVKLPYCSHVSSENKFKFYFLTVLNLQLILFYNERFLFEYLIQKIFVF